MVNNCDEFRPYGGPGQGPDGPWFLMGHLTHSGMVLVLYSYLLKGVILLLRQDSASIVQITWQNIQLAMGSSRHEHMTPIAVIHYYGKGLLKRLFWPLKALKSALIAGAGVGNKSASKSALVDPPFKSAFLEKALW